MTENKRNTALQILLWIVQGFLVGVGAILPGVSGGTLCYAFGIYDPMIEVLSTPIKGIKKHWFMLIFLGVGGLLGFAPVMPVNTCSNADFIARGGRIPAPLQSLKN